MSLSTMTVLLADSDPDCRTIYGTVLRQRGIRVLEAVDGEEALMRAREEIPTAIVLETMLPLLDGFEVAARLRDDPRTARISMVAVTWSANPEHRHRASAGGFATYLVKPCLPSDLVSEVARLLEGGR